MSAWYPLENRPDQIHEANQKLKDSGFNIVELDLNDIAVDSSAIIEGTTFEFIQSSLEKLK